jgi:hypothetical protein
LLVWIDVWLRRKCAPDSARPAYVWGFLFTFLFHFGFLLWWWRYGFKKALFVVMVCIVSTALFIELFEYFDWLEVEDLHESLFFGLFFAIPIRAIAGIWVANKDHVWRQSIDQGGQVETSSHSR